jgi:pyruvate/2-oxoglutarate dehydrogenase complex dihydrolipoamide dehydrogenase (E3) component
MKIKYFILEGSVDDGIIFYFLKSFFFSPLAAKLGQRVVIFDFVSPSGHGTTWGLGGTCVNVGCIPKKLMHAAALYGEALRDAKAYGWEMPENGVQHNWENLVSGVQDHIGSINWGYKTALNKEKVKRIIT